MRGINAGQDGNHSGSSPRVGTYYDEQPVTTIDGTVDVHIYDIARIEVLEGPQGTLYGASSESGTIRIITNKPDPTKFEAGYDVSGESFYTRRPGLDARGLCEHSPSSIAAIRLVGWDEHDPGYINNVAGTNANACILNGQRPFRPGRSDKRPDAGRNTPSDNYNTVARAGGRAALKWDMNDNWTMTPTVMGQPHRATGFFGYDPAVGTLQLVHFGPENSQDTFTAVRAHREGKVSDFDITYAGA